MKRIAGVSLVAVVFAIVLALAGCSSGGASSSASASGSSGTESGSSAASSASAESSSSATSSNTSGLANGQYTVTVTTDSSMFHINEADEGKGVLTVTDDGMTVHIHLASKKITNLFLGTAEEAQADGAKLIDPTTDTVTYKDGAQEEVYGFDVPVPALDEEFDVAIIGEKGKWYDHKVSVSDPVAM